MKSLRTAACVAAALAALASHAGAQCDELQLDAIDFSSPGQFGSAIDIGGTLMVAGTPMSPFGRLSLFRRAPGGGWLAVGTSSLYTSYGASVAVSDQGNNVASCPEWVNPAGGSGRITAFSWNGSTNSLVSHLLAPNIASYFFEDFGRSVAISEDGLWMVVGAPKTYTDAGDVLLYRFVAGTWVFKQDVYIGSAPDRFGQAVAISGTKVIVGAPTFDGAGGVDCGAIFFYDLDTNTETLTLSHSIDGPNAGMEFGTTVAIDGTLSAAGAPLDDTFGIDGGAVFFYVNGANVAGYGQVGGQLLGASIDIDNGNALVGRPGGNVVDRYKLNATSTSVDFVEAIGAAPLNAQPGEHFGAAVAIQDDACAVGATLYDGTSSADTGRVLTYEAIFSDMTYVDLGKALPGALGAPVLTLSGQMCAGHNYNIALTNAAPSSISAMIVGFAAINSKFNGGTLVPNPNVVVILPTNAGGGLAFSPPWPVGLDSLPLYFQWWIADPTGPFGMTASNAVHTVPPGWGP